MDTGSNPVLTAKYNSMKLEIGRFYFVSKSSKEKYKLVGFSDSGNNAFLSFNGVDMEDGGVVISKNKLLKINK